MDTRTPNEPGLADAFEVANGGIEPDLTEPDVKLFALLFRRGECTAVITEQTISVWYSWRMTALPSTYFVKLAPGLVYQLMRLGSVRALTGKTDFKTGPGSSGTGRYAFDYDQKWVRITPEADRIVIKVRDCQEGLSDSDPDHLVYVARCERCGGELRTPLAKQCLHCGLDWH